MDPLAFEKGIQFIKYHLAVAAGPAPNNGSGGVRAGPPANPSPLNVTVTLTGPGRAPRCKGPRLN